MRRLGADREILRIRLQRRLLVAGAHAARARHPGGLRPAQERDRKALRARAHGAARHGDDGLAHVPAKWPPVRRRGHAPTRESGAHPDSAGTGCALAMENVGRFLLRLLLVPLGGAFAITVAMAG